VSRQNSILSSVFWPHRFKHQRAWSFLGSISRIQDPLEKMKIFVSWSGPRSAAVAEALKEYLPMINNTFDLWLSSQDIAKGSRSTI
jgi:hypothetical protein